MNVLSTFDGMSCGLVALKRAGIKVDNYFASEIDKYAIQISTKNHPEIKHLGDVTKWRNWVLPKIDLLLGGFPCQGFSNAGVGGGFEDPRSKLFFELIDIFNVLKKINPDLKFLFENVKMKKEWMDIINKHVGIEPIAINSALVSAQNRKRLYWTNIEGVQQPEDRHIYLKDIIEDREVDREKSYCIDANYYKGGNPRSYFEDGRRQLVFEHQSQRRAMVRTECVQVGNLYPSGGIAGRIYSTDGKSPSLRTASGGNHMPKIAIVPEATKKGYVEIYPNEGVDLSYPKSATRRGRRMEDKCNALQASRQDFNWYDGFTYRKLIVVECERLQTLEDNYTDGVSDTQRYKMIGNGWTVDVIAHIFSYLGE